MIVPGDISADFAEAKLARSIVTVGTIFRPELGEPVRGAAAVGVDGVSQMQEKIRTRAPPKTGVPKRGFDSEMLTCEALP